MRLAIVLLALAACTKTGLPAMPSQGGPRWIELQSEHFTLWTDASLSRGRELVQEMEHMRNVILAVGFAGTHIAGRSLVFALRDADEVDVFVPEQFSAFAFWGGALKQSSIVLAADDESDVVKHELVHVVAFNVIRNQPRWFAEGLAEFFETISLKESKGDVGRPSPNTVARVRKGKTTPSAQMFACDAYSCMDDGFYATAWAMFSYLANTRPKQLLSYAAQIDAAPPGSAMKLWAESFPDLTPDALDHEVRKWLAYGKYTVWKFDVKLQQWPVTERVLTDADVYATRALLRMQFAKPDAPEPPELAMALAANPTHLIANLVKAELQKKFPLEPAKLVAAANEDDWRAWWLVGFAVDWKGPDAATARDRACAILAKNPSSSAPRNWCPLVPNAP